jgi:phenylacetate-CoA ligase
MLQHAYRQAAFTAHALRDERRSAADVQRMQDARVRVMVRHAWTSSRFYREKFDRAGLRPEDVQNAADLVHLPPTTKAELQILVNS